MVVIFSQCNNIEKKMQLAWISSFADALFLITALSIDSIAEPFSFGTPIWCCR